MSKKNILYLPLYPEVFIGWQEKTLHMGTVVIKGDGKDEIHRRSCHANYKDNNDYLTIDELVYEINEFKKDLDAATN
jgi:hypothetical protein